MHCSSILNNDSTSWQVLSQRFDTKSVTLVGLLIDERQRLATSQTSCILEGSQLHHPHRNLQSMEWERHIVSIFHQRLSGETRPCRSGYILENVISKMPRPIIEFRGRHVIASNSLLIVSTMKSCELLERGQTFQSFSSLQGQRFSFFQFNSISIQFNSIHYKRTLVLTLTSVRVQIGMNVQKTCHTSRKQRRVRKGRQVQQRSTVP